jgi:hypothetical protein
MSFAPSQIPARGGRYHDALSHSVRGRLRPGMPFMGVSSLARRGCQPLRRAAQFHSATGSHPFPTLGASTADERGEPADQQARLPSHILAGRGGGRPRENLNVAQRELQLPLRSQNRGLGSSHSKFCSGLHAEKSSGRQSARCATSQSTRSFAK